MIRDFSDLVAQLADDPLPHVALAGGNKTSSLALVAEALDRGLVREFSISGDPGKIKAGVSVSHLTRIECLGGEDAAECARRAVRAAAEDGALMKGHIDSSSYLRAILNKKEGLRDGLVLSNVTLASMASYPKLLAATDNGILMAPDLAEKRAIVLNALALMRGLGLDLVRVAAIAASEKVSEAQIASVDARTLADESVSGAFPGAVVEGPFGYDAAINSAAAASKGLANSDVAGQADLLLFPTIEAANAVVKSWKYHGDAETGSIILGARIPILLNSRSDGTRKRLNSLALARAALSSAPSGSNSTANYGTPIQPTNLRSAK